MFQHADKEVRIVFYFSMITRRFAVMVVATSSRVDRACDTEAVDSGSIPGRVKSKTIKIDIYNFPA